jgi:hypothetical protein
LSTEPAQSYQQIPPPLWIESGAKQIKGLDLLGLRLPVQVIGNSLLTGVTTITPSVRYLSLRAWITYVYLQARQPDDWKPFKDFAARVEAAIALGSLIADPDVAGVLGAVEARNLINSGEDPLRLKALVYQLAVSVYAGPSDQLGITYQRESGIPGLTKERGAPLANFVNEWLCRSELGGAFSHVSPVGRASLTQLKEFGAFASIGRIPEEERSLLVSILLPPEPRPEDVNRLTSYTLLLFLSDQLGRAPNEKDLFAAAYTKKGSLPYEFQAVIDGWLRYCVRDMLAATHEAVLQQITAALERLSEEERFSTPVFDLVQSLVARVDDHREALRDLEVLRAGESPLTLSFRDFFARIEELTCKGLEEENGLLRWLGHLNETATYETAFANGAGALAVLPLAWPGVQSINIYGYPGRECQLTRVVTWHCLQATGVCWDTERAIKLDELPHESATPSVGCANCFWYRTTASQRRAGKS